MRPARTRTAASLRTTRSAKSSRSWPSTRSAASSSSRCRARAGSFHSPTTSRTAARACRKHGALFVADEVQSGIGRTGPVWAIEHYGVEPDLLVSGKSLGGGLPLAGVTGPAELMDAVEPGGLGGTFGGNPVACAAPGRARRGRLGQLACARNELTDLIAGRLLEIQGGNDHCGEVRGLGPMQAVELVRDHESKEPAPDLAKATTPPRASRASCSSRAAPTAT